MQERQSGLRPGALVRARGERWRLAAASAFPACELLHLDGIDVTNRGLRRVLLYPFDRPTTVTRTARVKAVRQTRWRRAFRALVSTAVPHDALQTAAFARLDLLAFQLEPVLAVLRGHGSRLLLADDVGLGKTIQAGLILSELTARGHADRALILTPAGLREQWAHELATRFSLDAVVVDAESLRRAVVTLPRGVNPWTLPGIRIASVDFIKRLEVLQALEPVIWDLLVVDEAHAATLSSDRGTAVRALAARARRVALLTATPHAGDDAAFTSLCDVGRLAAAGDNDPILLFRRSRADAGIAAARRTRLLFVHPGEEEQRMHTLLDQYARRVWREATRRGDDEALLAVVVLKKRALSSARSLAASVARRLDRLRCGTAPVTQLPLPLASTTGSGDDQESADEPPDDTLAAPGLDNASHERAWLGALHAAALAVRWESKLSRLTRFVRRTAEPLIVFTEYRDTLLRIATALQPLASAAILHGGLARAERLAALAQFLSGETRLLLATDVAGEGLNLQARCRLVVNFELPWNPVRLEQRIGRVDRIGQQRSVHALLLVAQGTAEADILARLVVRLERARAALGHLDAVTGRIPESILAKAMVNGDLPAFLTSSVTLADRDEAGASQSAGPAPADEPVLVRRADLGEEATVECQRLNQARRLLRQGRRIIDAGGLAETIAHLDRAAPWLSVIRVPRLAGDWRHLRGVLLLTRTTIVDSAGRQVETVLIPLLLPAQHPPRVRTCRAARALAEQLKPALAAIRRVAHHRAAQRLLALQQGRARAVLAARDREAMLLAAFEAGIARPLLQPGLFDRRALREADYHRQRAETSRLDARTQLAALDASLALELSGEPEVVLVGITE